MGSIYKRGATYWIKYYRGGRPFRESTHSNKMTAARRLLALREGQIVEGRFPGLASEKLRFEDLVQDYLSDYVVNQKKSWDDAERYARYLKEAFGGLRAMEITSDKIAAYIEQRRKNGSSNATINRELGALRRIFNLAAHQQPPKVFQVPPIPHLKEHNIRTGFLEHDEFLSLRGALPDHQKVPVTIGYWTGMRLGEIVSLQWRQVDFDRGLLRLEPGTTKSGEGRSIPFLGDLGDVLDRWRKATIERWPSCPWVCHYAGQQLTRLTRAWKTACRRVGLEGRLFHDLRRTAIRNMVRAGISERVAMQISGHKTRSVFDRYDIVSERDLCEAADRLNTHFRVLPFAGSRATVWRGKD